LCPRRFVTDGRRRLAKLESGLARSDPKLPELGHEGRKSFFARKSDRAFVEIVGDPSFHEKRQEDVGRARMSSILQIEQPLHAACDLALPRSGRWRTGPTGEGNRLRPGCPHGGSPTTARGEGRMSTLLLLVYAAICIGLFRFCRLPVTKWTMTTAVVGGVFLVGGIVVVMNYNHLPEHLAYFFGVYFSPHINQRARGISCSG
jgi:hypothetical protein